jgi:hypothetical protein
MSVEAKTTFLSLRMRNDSLMMLTEVCNKEEVSFY